MASTTDQQTEPIDVETYESTAESCPEDTGCELNADDYVIEQDDVCGDNPDYMWQDMMGWRQHPGRPGPWGRFRRFGRHGDDHHGGHGGHHDHHGGGPRHGDWFNRGPPRPMRWRRGCHGDGDREDFGGKNGEQRCCAGKRMDVKAWKRSMKERKKFEKGGKHCGDRKFGGKHGKRGKHDKNEPWKEDIHVYMGEYTSDEVTVTLTQGNVKINGDHSSGAEYCRPHSVVHTYAAPKDAERRLMKAVLFPRGMLQVSFLDPSELPVQLPVRDDITVATEAIADMNVATAN